MKNPEKDILEKGKEKLEQLKVVFEELEVQLALGRKEAKEAFEREKKNFQEFIQDQRERFQEEEERAESHRKTLLNKFQLLEAALSVEPPVDQTAFKEFKDKQLQGIYELEAEIKAAYDNLRFSLRERLDQFKAKLDAYRIQLALVDFEKREELEGKREELKKKTEEMVGLMHKEAERGDKIENFTEEVTASFDHLKRAFTELFS